MIFHSKKFEQEDLQYQNLRDFILLSAMRYDIRMLSLVPYKTIPVKSGGHAGITLMHNAIGKFCEDHIISTSDNELNPSYSFKSSNIFTPSLFRYIPYSYQNKLLAQAKKYNINTIYCDHPYMMPSAISLARRLKIPVYMRSHNIESERFKTLGKKWWPLMFKFERYAMKNATGIFFVTQEDMQWAINHYKLLPAQCHVAPFGVNQKVAPVKMGFEKKQISDQFNINTNRPWLYFLGVLDYYPNIQAVNFILDEILPRLNKNNFEYKLLIAGKGLPQQIVDRINKIPNVHYLGFVPDLDIFLKSCDIMLNPVLLGGGIKTKALEALAYNKIVVSMKTAAMGLNGDACGDNLHVVDDNDWDSFTQQLINSSHQTPDIKPAFFQQYNWDNIAINLLEIINKDLLKSKINQK